MPLVYAGIDEAGYGPMLGPLTVAMAVFRVDHPAASFNRPIDLWQRLRPAVAKSLSDTPRAIPIADSKKLKLPNAGKRHPLLHLERGVLAAVDAASGTPPPTDRDLAERLGTDIPPAPWYSGAPVSLPVSRDGSERPLDANILRAAFARAGVSLLALRCEIIDEPTFNRLLRDAGSKAAVTQRVVARLIKEALDRWSRPGGDTLRIAIDRQSGRTDYEPFIRDADPNARITRRDRGDAVSRYELASPALGDVAVRFETEAEAAHLPVALASMTAKLVRELLMRRFNAYWSARVPELKPTAGYYADARRWLADAEPAITAQERAQLVRLA